jgi:hypothetical protein
MVNIFEFNQLIYMKYLFITYYPSMKYFIVELKSIKIN